MKRAEIEDGCKLPASGQQVKSSFEMECDEFVTRLTEVAVRSAYDAQTKSLRGKTMNDTEKVVEGLRRCASTTDRGHYVCHECPYFDTPMEDIYATCRRTLMQDARKVILSLSARQPGEEATNEQV